MSILDKYLEEIAQEKQQNIKERANAINLILNKLNQKYKGMINFSLFVKGKDNTDVDVIKEKDLLKYLQDEKNNDIEISLALTPVGYPSERNVVELTNQTFITKKLLPKIIQIVEKTLKNIEKETDTNNNQKD
jgi:hypothetical protein